MATNPWDAFPAVGQAPAAPSYPGVIPGRPKAADPIAARRLELDEAGAAQDATRDALLNQLTEVQIREREAKLAEDAKAAEASSAAYDTAKEKLTRVIAKMNEVGLDANDNEGWFETGTSGSFARGNLPEGLAGSDLSKNLDTIRANFAFDALQAMRDASKTGGALGSITEQELKLLESTVASLDPNQSHAQFLLNLAQAKEAYLDKLRAIDPAEADRLASDPGPFVDEEGTLGIRYERSDGESATGANPPSGGGGFFGVNSLAELGRGLSQGAGSVVEGAAALPGIVINPAGQALYDAFGYDQRYDTGTILREGLGLEDNPSELGDAVIQGTAAALTGSGAARGLSTLTRPGVTQGVLSTIGRTPVRDTVAGGAAGAGAIAGRRSGVPGGEVVGALAGGVAGYGGAGALSRVGAARTPNALLSHADDIGVTMLPADVGGTGTRMASGVLGRTLGGIPLAEGAERATVSAGNARNRVAAAIGDVTDDTGAGQGVRRGFGKFQKSSLKRADELAERIDVPSEAPVRLENTREALGEVTKGFQSNPELSRLWTNYPRLRQSLEALTPKDVATDGRRSFMEASERLTDAQMTYDRMRNSVTSPDRLVAARKVVDDARLDVQRAQRESTREPVGGELSWQDMKRFRSIVGEIVGQPGVSRDGSDIAALRKLYGALSEDMRLTAASTSPKAEQQFNRLNQFWRGRESRIEDVFTRLLGDTDGRSDAAVFRQINQWAKREGGDFNRLARTIRSLPEDEANTVRATIIQRMGWAKPGRQEGAGEVFSPSEFATQWHGLSGRAKSVLFPKQEHRQNLDKLAKVMDSMKAAGEFTNFSNTSLGTNAAAHAVGLTIEPITTATLAALQFAGGKLLASPRFARWLASAPKTNRPAAVRKWTEDLGVLAAREPLIAGEVRSLQQSLMGNVNDNAVTAAAAAPEERDKPQR